MKYYSLLGFLLLFLQFPGFTDPHLGVIIRIALTQSFQFWQIGFYLSLFLLSSQLFSQFLCSDLVTVVWCRLVVKLTQIILDFGRIIFWRIINLQWLQAQLCAKFIGFLDGQWGLCPAALGSRRWTALFGNLWWRWCRRMRRLGDLWWRWRVDNLNCKEKEDVFLLSMHQHQRLFFISHIPSLS